MRARAAVLAGLASGFVVYLAFFLWGVDVSHRGAAAGLCFVLCVLAFNAGVAAWRIWGPYEKPIDPPAVVETPTRTAVLSGALEAIKQIAEKHQGIEQKLKELEGRMSEVSLAAGLRPPRPGGVHGAPDPEKRT